MLRMPSELFAEIREIIKGVTTEKGLREYLILLSICETCKRRGISFIDFLCSGEMDLERFAGAKNIAVRKGCEATSVKICSLGAA